MSDALMAVPRRARWAYGRFSFDTSWVTSDIDTVIVGGRLLKHRVELVGLDLTRARRVEVDAATLIR
ncbi:hypothetical protein OG864_06355 [Streptomyces sp. NBC_00124]|uniref:hypothetical protein n=1 Tax=Streptomyces sp. NBC_00124 TaxID=2975662 RepID=UPI0022558704|nr:hypothetical protein [Streptomyces sp. NBC_00124]MCX5358312.1 hypothetical protein [Streptomyces sp. NBC_00124]